MRFLKMSVLVLSLFLAACSSVNSKISASNNINPDIDGTPSPLAISIFELSNVSSFEHASFFDLYSNAKQVLGASLLSEKDIVLSPGQTVNVSMPYVQGARYLAYVGAFRDVNVVLWRGVVAISNKPDLGSSVSVLVDHKGLHVLPAKLNGAL